MDNVVSKSRRPADEFLDRLSAGSPEGAVEIATQRLAKNADSAVVMRNAATLVEEVIEKVFERRALGDPR